MYGRSARWGDGQNWLFSDSVRSVRGSAGLYSLIETAKANELEPHQYLRQVFTTLPQADSAEAIVCLLRWRVKKSLRRR
jgi:transposase